MKLHELENGRKFRFISSDTGSTNINTIEVYRKEKDRIYPVSPARVSGSSYAALQYLYWDVQPVDKGHVQTTHGCVRRETMKNLGETLVQYNYARLQLERIETERYANMLETLEKSAKASNTTDKQLSAARREAIDAHQLRKRIDYARMEEL